jgi:PEP-CTERM motif-containing protein
LEVSLTGELTIEDQLVGVVNNSATSLSALNITGSTDIFAFDGDGVCIGYALTGCGTGSTGTGAGYAPQGDTFSGINGTFTSGTINFGTPIAGGGGIGFFSLEGPPSAGAGLGGSVGGVPEPSSLLLLGSGLFGLVAYGRRKFSSI